jgi:hypothetical protein
MSSGPDKKGILLEQIIQRAGYDAKMAYELLVITG